MALVKPVNLILVATTDSLIVRWFETKLLSCNISTGSMRSRPLDNMIGCVILNAETRTGYGTVGYRTTSFNLIVDFEVDKASLSILIKLKLHTLGDKREVSPTNTYLPRLPFLLRKSQC